MGEDRKLPGGVWHGTDTFGDPVAIDAEGRAWSWSMGRWYEMKVAYPFAAAFVAERARTEKAEHDAGLAEALAKAAQERADALARRLAAYENGDAARDLADFRAVARGRTT